MSGAVVHGFRISSDSLAKPAVVMAGQPKIVQASKPVETKMLSHHGVKKDAVSYPVKGGEFNTPGQNGWELPDTASSAGITFPASMPEIVPARNPSSKDFNPHSFASFGMIQGLKTNQIRCLLEDHTGNLWFSSDDGVTRYDGKYLSHFVISSTANKSSIVLCMLEDRSGTLWFGTFGGGLLRFDGKNYTQYTEQEGLSNDIINSIIEDRSGNLWMATSGGGISKFDGRTFTNYSTKQGLAGDQVRSLMEDRNGNIWIGTFGKGVSCFDGNHFVNYTTQGGFPYTHIASLFQDREGAIWFGSFNQGVGKYDGNRMVQYSDDQGLPGSSVLCMVQEQNGTIWMGTSLGGIAKFDGLRFTSFQEEDGLPNNYVRCALIGRQGDLWFGTRDGGLVRFNRNLFTHYTESDGLSASKVYGIARDHHGDHWFATFGGGISRFDGERFYAYSLKECYMNSFVYAILEDRKGSIWFGGDGGGITRFDGKKFYQYTRREGLCNDAVRCMVEDRQQNLWIGTYGGGVSKFDGKNFVQYTEKEGLSSDKVMCLMQDQHGVIWFGTDGGGVCAFDGKEFTRYSVSEGLNNSTVTSIFEDREGMIWIGTSGGGLTRFDGKFFVPFTKKEGLSNNFVTSIRQDFNGNLWVGTRLGPNILRAELLRMTPNEHTTNVFKNYSYDEGFLGMGCNLNSILMDPDHTIWIGSTNRLSAIRPEEDIADTIPLNVRLTRVKLFNELVPWNSLQAAKDTSFDLENRIRVNDLRFDGISNWYFLPQNLSLAYSNNFISLSYIGISQKHTQKIKYQYKLEGLNDYWSSQTDLTEVTYGNLSPGQYIFKVKALNSEGIWSSEYAYQFTIRKPWWQTFWFYTLSLVLFGFLIYSFLKWREHEHREQRELLNKKIAEQTGELKEKNNQLEAKNQELQLANSEKDKFFSIIAHDVRGPLSTFMLFTEMMSENLQSYDIKEIRSMVDSMKDSASNLYKLLENLLEWTRMQRGLIRYNPEQLNIIEVFGDSIETLHHAAKNKSIALVVDIPTNIEVIADRNMLESVIRNLLSNAIKFTPKGGKIVIKAQTMNREKVQISVADNGIGMDEEMIDNLFRMDVYNNRKGTEGEPSVGLGLLLCKDLVEKQDGKIWAESRVDQGSTFFISLKHPSKGI